MIEAIIDDNNRRIIMDGWAVYSFDYLDKLLNGYKSILDDHEYRLAALNLYKERILEIDIYSEW